MRSEPKTSASRPNAARELGHQTLMRKVRRALNKALNAEHNAGRLKTDWQLVWRPKKSR